MRQETVKDMLYSLLETARNTHGAGVWVALIEETIQRSEERGQWPLREPMLNHFIRAAQNTQGAEVWRYLFAGMLKTEENT